LTVQGRSKKKPRRQKSEEEATRPYYLYSPSPPLSVTTPQIAAEWHPSKNGPWTADDFTYGSQEKVWWLCSACKYSWQARIGDRTISHSGCPSCAGDVPTKTYNLKVLHPKIASQWHTSKNGRLKPEQCLPSSNKQVWWRCAVSSDHIWQATIANRTFNGNGCPGCSGRMASRTNSLAALFPDLAKQWHPTKNGSLKPTDVTYGSDRRIWWKCPEGPDHIWQGPVLNRTKTGKGCPFCHSLRPSVTNVLIVLYPQIAAEIHPSKNPNLKRKELIARSPLKIWWRCRGNKQHEWQARIQDRTQKGSGCPKCARKTKSPN